jgi:hypothetical protein
MRDSGVTGENGNRKAGIMASKKVFEQVLIAPARAGRGIHHPLRWGVNRQLRLWPLNLALNPQASEIIPASAY